MHSETKAYQQGYRAGQKKPQKQEQNPLDLTKPEKLLLQQIYAKLHVVFLLTKNLGIEVSQLRAEQVKLRSVVLTLLADPQAQHDREAVERDLRIQTYKKE